MIRLIYGDSFQLDAQRSAAVSEFLDSHDAFGLQNVDCEEASDSSIRDALLQLPFLVDKKLVVLRNVFSQKQVTELVEFLLPKIAEEVDVLIIESKPDKRTKLFKQLQATKMALELKPLKDHQLERWVVDYAKQLGSEISPRVANYLVHRVGDNQLNLARELEKLASQPTIDTALIDSLTEEKLESTVFDLIDTVLQGDIKACLRRYDKLLAMSVDPNEVIGLIAWQLHVIALVAYADGRETGLHPFVAQKANRAVSNITKPKLKKLIAMTLRTDIAIKTGQQDAESAVRVLLLEFAETTKELSNDCQHWFTMVWKDASCCVG